VVGWSSLRNGHLASLWILVALELGLAISRDLFSRAKPWRDRLTTTSGLPCASAHRAKKGQNLRPEPFP
jgi:hypothetical protein